MESDVVLRSIEREAPEKGLPIIGPKRGLLLDEVVRKFAPRRVLEVGTLVGYSAIRIGRLLKDDGRVTCVELNEEMAGIARANIENAGLGNKVEVIVGDAKMVLPELKGMFDMVFLDAVKSEYITYLKSCERLLHQGSVVVADNVKSFAGELAGYLDYVRNSGKYTSTYKEAPPNYESMQGDAVEISVRL